MFALPFIAASAEVDPGPTGVALAGLLILFNGFLSWRYGLGLGRVLAWGSIRMTVQLLAMGYILTYVFDWNLWWVTLPLLVFIGVFGGLIAVQGNKRRFAGMRWLAVRVELLMVFGISAFTCYGILGLGTRNADVSWLEPRIIISIFGMIAGNCLNGISLGLDRMMDGLKERRVEVEALLAAGASRGEATHSIVVAALRNGMLPTINNMMAIGLVFMPGMMTGQILANMPVMIAVRYQIVIMFAIAAGRAFGTYLAVVMGTRRLFDERQRLRLDWIHDKK